MTPECTLAPHNMRKPKVCGGLGQFWIGLGSVLGWFGDAFLFWQGFGEILVDLDLIVSLSQQRPKTPARKERVEARKSGKCSLRNRSDKSYKSYDLKSLKS